MTPLRLICVNIESPPLFTKETAETPRVGYEVDVAQAVAEAAGRRVEWIYLPWSEMIPALNDGAGAAILCGQGITEHRSELVSFTRPYAVFDEAVLVRRGENITSAQDLAGKRVLAIADSTNIALAQTFTGAEVVPFTASGEDVLGELVAALRSGDVDAVVDDEVALQPLTTADDLDIAFSVPTGNRWAMAVAKDNPSVLDELDGALAQAFAVGAVRRAWVRWLPGLQYPFAEAHAGEPV
ncbi:substrate-binding periplasmic protein [Mycobacterium sp. SMC-4]|uniref:substrate-binding periplasmic protein n=1 Tax=Mycobacterium sp. SMC-4 TaxID=2857059 RepID=UPI003D06FB82